MIQTFTVTAPVADCDEKALCATVSGAAAKVTAKYPALLEMGVTASEGLLTLTLRVSALNRWATSYAARRIASSLLHRAKVDVDSASMELTSTASAGRSLTKEQGRSIHNAVELKPASEEP